MNPSLRGAVPEAESGPLPGVRLSRDGPVATVTLCRPEALNAQTVDMLAALRSFGVNLPGDVRVVVVRGEGRAFSAGLRLGGLPQLAELPPAEADQQLAQFQDAYSWLRRPDLITVAAVRGCAIGAGFQLALACDLRVLATDAELVMPEVGLGLVPGLGGSKRLAELVGYARALEICITGRRISAEEAERWGLASAVVPSSGLQAAVEQLVGAVLAAPRDAVIEAKALLAAAASRGFAEQEAAERAAELRRIHDLVGLGE